MTTIFNDNVQTTMTIDGDEWLVADAEVELSQVSTPNYVDINKMIPGESVQVPSPPDGLVSKDFELYADNDLITERTTDAEEDTLLFKGKLANISAIGTRAYEGIAYDPSQQPVASPGQGGGNGSVLNQQIFITPPYYGFAYMYARGSGTQYEPKTIKGAELVDKIVAEIPGVDDVENQLTENGVTRTGPNGSVTGAYNRELSFDNLKISLQKGIEKVREECECDWWFDKEGTLYFGVPEPIAHELRFITDASDGLTTPPYQSVKVIGSGIASEEGYYRSHLRPEERIVVNASWADNQDVVYGETVQPQFEYRNNEISTEAQARSVARKLTEDLKKQQANGKVTVTGFPEVTPFDAVIMPQAADEGGTNYQPGMPMGGNRYGVYKVVHRLNGSDGFKTIIHVCGLTNTSRIAVDRPTGGTLLVDRGDWAEVSPRDRATIARLGGL